MMEYVGWGSKCIHMIGSWLFLIGAVLYILEYPFIGGVIYLICAICYVIASICDVIIHSKKPKN